MANVTFQSVTKRFGKVEAVKDFSLEIEHGEFIALVGPSGCGKSTTLRMLAGLEAISEGDIHIGDTLVNNVPARDRDIAMVFQSYALYPHMCVYDNMAFGLSLRKMPKTEIREAVARASEILGIEDLLDRKPRQLSGGQRQRVALGRAIVRDPAVFLLDEPLSNLDAKLRVQTRAELSKLHDRLGATFVYVTHDQVEAMTMASRIAVMEAGILHQVGEPQYLYDHPINVFVAGFIGSPSMNFFDATVEDGHLNASGVRLPVPPGLHDRVGAGDRVTAGLRPEHIHDARFVPTETNTASVPAKVEVTELLGNEILLHVEAAETTLLARVDPRSPARPGDNIDLAFDLRSLHLFDAESGEVITPVADSAEQPA